MRDDAEATLSLDRFDGLLDMGEHLHTLLRKQAEKMAFARRHLDPPDQVDVSDPLAVDDLLRAFGAFQVIVIGDGDHFQTTPPRLAQHALWAGRAVAQVGVHMQVGLRKPGSIGGVGLARYSFSHNRKLTHWARRFTPHGVRSAGGSQSLLACTRPRYR